MSFLRKEIQRREKNRSSFKRYALVLTSAAVIVSAILFSYNLYFTPAAYIDVDVNPSVELTLNRFDRVIGSHAYNDDGENVLAGLALNNVDYNDALTILLDVIAQKGYLSDDGLVSVTIQTDMAQKENQLLSNTQTEISAYLAGHHGAQQIDVFPVSGDTRDCAYEKGLSPAKYIAIQELLRVDPTASMETCRNHSINELKQLAQEHGGHHGGNSTDNEDEPDNEVVEETNEEEELVQGTGHSGSHHGEGNGNKWHKGHD